MPVPTLNGLPPFSDLDDIKTKINQLVFEIVNMMVSLDSLNVVSLTADHVDAGTLNAGKVTIRVDYSTGAYILLDHNGMTINDGTKDTFRANINGQVTMTGAKVQTTAGIYPLIELNGANNFLRASQSASNYISIDPNLFGPTVTFNNGVMQGYIYALTASIVNQLVIQSDHDLQLAAPTGNVKIASQYGSISDLVQAINNLTAAIAGKVDTGSTTSNVSNHNHGIPDGTLLLGADGITTYMFNSAGGHSHTV